MAKDPLPPRSLYESQGAGPREPKPVKKIEKVRKDMEETAKRGRPAIGEPWKAEGISRRTWFNRQKAAKSNE